MTAADLFGILIVGIFFGLPCLILLYDLADAVSESIKDDARQLDALKKKDDK